MCTLCLLEDVLLAEYVYLVFTGGCTFGRMCVPCVYWRMYFWPNACTLCLLEDVLLAECVYLVFTAGCNFGGVCVPCVYSHAWWELLCVSRVYAGTLARRDTGVEGRMGDSVHDCFQWKDNVTL